MSDSRGFPFDSLGRRFMKFAEKKLQHGINYLEAKANSVNTNHASPYHDHGPRPDFSHSPFNIAPSPFQPTSADTNFIAPNRYDTPDPDFNPSISHAAHPPHGYGAPSPASTFVGGPPPPAPFTEPFPQSHTYTPTTAKPHTSDTASVMLNASGPIITQDLLLHMQARIPSACVSLGSSTVKEARKGLSRVLSPTRQDIDLFGTQLKNSQREAVEPNWSDIDDEIPCFAISYVQHTPQGRYKFSDGQWTNFHAVVQAIAAARIKHFRVWLDQCLWLRDASQASWAHTGIVPYVLWPVIALGVKAPDGERTKDSFHRMWPFVEQLAGLWGMGVIIASEYRNHNLSEGDDRAWLSYNLRVRTEPELDLIIILLNIFHGAADALETGWVDDVLELREMAKANVMYSNKQIIIGSDWKSKFSSIEPLRCSAAIDNITLPVEDEYLGGVDIYLDGSRTLKCDSWHGTREWLSGNEGPIPSDSHDLSMLDIGMEKYNLITNFGEYQLLDRGSTGSALWLVVAMQGSSSNFSRGRVAWTKVLTGPGSCRIGEMMEHHNLSGIQGVLREELRNPSLRVESAKLVDGAIQWI